MNASAHHTFLIYKCKKILKSISFYLKFVIMHHFELKGQINNFFIVSILRISSIFSIVSMGLLNMFTYLNQLVLVLNYSRLESSLLPMLLFK